MTQAEFQSALRTVLETHTSSTSRNVGEMLTRVPANARSLDLEIFTSQDGDGQFDVQASCGGPDLYALNKALGSAAHLFGVRMGSAGFDPPVPMVDPGDVDFSVNDTIVDVVATWLQDVWRAATPPEHGVAVFIRGHDGYGTITPLRLRG